MHNTLIGFWVFGVRLGSKNEERELSAIGRCSMIQLPFVNKLNFSMKSQINVDIFGVVSVLKD